MSYIRRRHVDYFGRWKDGMKRFCMHTLLWNFYNDPDESVSSRARQAVLRKVRKLHAAGHEWVKVEAPDHTTVYVSRHRDPATVQDEED